VVITAIADMSWQPDIVVHLPFKCAWLTIDWALHNLEAFGGPKSALIDPSGKFNNLSMEATAIA